MKKHLLTLTLAFAAMSAYADTAVFDFTGDEAYGMELLSGSTNAYNPDPTVCTEGQVTLTLTGKTRWWGASSGPELRMYKESSMSVAVPNGYHVSEVTLDALVPGSFSGNGYEAPTWTGSLAQVVINCAVTSGNSPIYKITVTYAAGDPTGEIIPDDPVSAWGKYERATTFAPGKYLIYANDRVAVANTSNHGYLQTTPVVVADDQTIITKKANAFEFVSAANGYCILDGNGRYLYQDAEYNSFSYAGTVTPGDDSFVWNVEPGDDGFHIYNSVTGKAFYFNEQYNSYGAYAEAEEGYVQPQLFAFVEDAAEPTAPADDRTIVNSLSEIYTLANNEKIQVNCPLTVITAQSPYYYITDGTGYGLIYKGDLGLNDLDVIKAGWTGKVSIYQNLYELVPDVDLTANGTAQAVAPVDVTADNAAQMLVADKQNVFVQLSGVVFESATPAADAEGDDRSFTGTLGEETVAFYQRFGVESVQAGIYDVIGYVSVYKETVQVLPISFAPSAGVAGIAADNAPAIYYNMQGVRVDHPTPGNVYIRVAAGKPSKIIK